jgi:large subunit ribosomal protein L14
MIQRGTYLTVADNTGALKVKCIQAMGGFFKKTAFIGDLILVSVKSIRLVRKIKKGQIYLGIIVRTKQNISYKDGSNTKFGTNAIVLLNSSKKILGNRLFGPVSRSLRKRKMLRLILMSGYEAI